jgi:phenylpyruvate tautomerase PptA (4-oxalocrotonate tautomerase family)
MGHIKRESNSMPLYTVTTPDGLLSAQQRDAIAAELVRIHMAAMHVPANFVHSIFQLIREIMPTRPRIARRSARLLA